MCTLASCNPARCEFSFEVPRSKVSLAIAITNNYKSRIIYSKVWFLELACIGLENDNIITQYTECWVSFVLVHVPARVFLMEIFTLALSNIFTLSL